MEDNRRKFLLQLLAAGGGAAALPELVEAAQASLKLQKPLAAKILNRETVKDEPFVDSHIQMEITGANGLRQVSTAHLTQYQDAAGRRIWITIQTDTFENASAAKPISSDIFTSHDISKKIDSSTEEITSTMAINGKLYTHKVRATTPSAHLSAEGLSDEELVQKFFTAKVEGGAK